MFKYLFPWNWSTQSIEEATVKELVSDKWPCVFVDSETTVEEVAKLLHDNNFLSVFVWSEDQKKFIGFVDVLDILEYVESFIIEDLMFLYRL